MKIALIGTHGVGKTTLCYDLAAHLKKRNADVELVREVARRCPLPINEGTTAAAQAWILHTQICEEIVATSNSTVVLCDRSALDNYCYMVHAGGASKAWNGLLDDWLTTYDLLIHIPIIERPSYDGIRAVDPHFQEQIQLLLDGMIAARGLRPLRLEADQRENWCRQILDLVLPELQPTLPLFPSEEAE
jgi:GTPase SAR1 family protein